MRSRIGVAAVLVMVWTLGSAHAAVPESERVAVTDPTELAALGLPPDASGVYRRVGSLDAPLDEIVPDDYGVLTINHTAIMGRAFDPGSNDFRPNKLSGSGVLVCENGGSDTTAYAQLDLPDGAEFFGVRVWAYDTDGGANQDVWIAIAELCQADFAASSVSFTLLTASYVTSGSSGNQSASRSLAGGPITVDNTSCVYQIYVELGAPDCRGSSLALQKVRAEWRRQLSPAPATATFSDVPTNHPFFQHVEALADSGITAGCGATTYCPDAPLTRGQMAVFLAKALGLHWTVSNH